MGSTVTTQCAVGVITGLDEPIFVMWEETYEKNCHPHEPHWHVVMAGTKAEFLRRVFERASSCEGGMLQARNGDMKPEAYIQRWLKAAQNPHRIETFMVELTYGGAWKTTFTNNAENEEWRVEEASKDANHLEWMRQEGLSDLVDRMIEGERIKLDFRSHAGLILGLQRRGKALWRMGAVSYPFGVHDATYALDHRPTGKMMDPPKFEQYVEIERGDFYRLEGSKLNFAESSWMLIERFVAGYWEQEMQHPGTFRKAIRALREHLNASPKGVNMDIDLIFDNDAPSQYHNGLKNELSNLLGGRQRIPIAEALRALTEGQRQGYLRYGQEFIHFELNETTTDGDHDAEHTGQMTLLAA